MTEGISASADVPAKTWHLLASSVLNLIIVALVVATVVLWNSAGDLLRTLVMPLSTLVTIVLTVMRWRLRTYRGTSLGHLLLELCSADPMTGLSDRSPSLRAVDIRHSQDPLRPRSRLLVLDTTVPRRPPVDVILITSLDDGSSYRLGMPCMIGCDPRMAPPYHCLTVTDIGRTISRTYLMLWNESGLLLLSDMGNRGGTAIIIAQGNRLLPADQTISFPMAPDLLAHFRLGQRELRIEALPDLPRTR